MRSFRSLVLAGLAAASFAAPGWPARAAGPIPAPIPPSGLAVEISEFVQIPASAGSPPLARLNLLTHAGDGSGRLFVNDMRGKIWIVENGSVLPTPFLDAAAALGGDLFTAGLQRGLTTFGFHPGHADPESPGFGLFYTATHETTTSGTPDFTAPTTATHHNVIAEWHVDPLDPDAIDPTSRREILRIEGFSGDHPLGQIAFDPNADPGDPDYGMLYAAFGDGGGYLAGVGQEIDPFRVAQDLTRPYGAILRIDPLGTSTPQHPTNGEYGIPADNPFAGMGGGVVEEIWAYGLRNPHRFHWDAGGDGKMLITDIGQAQVEEVDLGAAGANYGWSERQGTWVLDHDDQSVFPPLPPDDATFGYTYPVAQYDHDEGSAIVGAGVYRGSAIPSLVGEYVFGDIVNGRLFHTDADALMDGSQAPLYELTLLQDGQEVTLLELLGNDFRADLRFGVDEAGEIYVLTKRDGKARLLPEPSPPLLLAAGLATLAPLESIRRRRVRRTTYHPR